MKFVTRTAFCAGAVATLVPASALASSQDDKRRFISQCDESISVDRLAGAPYKFVGKKVDLHGTVGPPSDGTYINFESPDEDSDNFVVVLADSRKLERGQSLRVLGIVQQPISTTNNQGGSGTYAVVRKVYME